MNASWLAPGLLQATFDPAHTTYKPQRKSLPPLDTVPKTTTLYLTSTAELRGDRDIYMLGIDKCYTTLEEANARVEVLGRCNINARSVETKLVHTDTETGCISVTWGRYGSQVRFVARAKKVVVAGEVADEDKGCTSPGAWDKNEIGLFFAEMQLDVAGHVWAVAVHKPGMSMVDDGIARHHSLSRGRRGSMSGRSLNASKLLNSVEEEQCGLGWSIDSLHVDSEKAMHRAKRAWNVHFRSSHGRCKKIREHYGFARYAFKPTSVGKSDADYETCVQIRIERVKVVPKGEIVSDYLMANALDKSLAAKSYRHIMPSLKNDQNVGRAFEGQMVSTSTCQRSSFVAGLQRIADETFQDGYDYEDLPLAHRIKHEHLLRFGNDLTNHRHDEDGGMGYSTADLYHALLQDLDMLNPPKKRTGKGKAKTPSQAFVRARKRMVAALDETSALYEKVGKVEEGTAETDASSPKAADIAVDGSATLTGHGMSVSPDTKETLHCVADCQQLLPRSSSLQSSASPSAKDSVTGREEVLRAKDFVTDAQESS